MLELDVLDKFENYEDFLNYDMIYTNYDPKKPKWLSILSTL